MCKALKLCVTVSGRLALTSISPQSDSLLCAVDLSPKLKWISPWTEADSLNSVCVFNLKNVRHSKNWIISQV